MKISKKGKELIAKWEGIRLKAYLCSAKRVTIGLGNTQYENGLPVKLGDTITIDRAYQLFDNIIQYFEKNLSNVVKKPLNQNQIDALLCLSYNIGVGAFNSSTLLKKVNVDPNDLSIKDEFLKWNKIKGVENKGLSNRRKDESNYYYK
jgi:lysozyme